MANKTQEHYHKWCIMRSNELLRLLIKKRMDEENLSMRDLEALTEIHYDCIRKYLAGDRIGISQYQLFKLADTLGFELGLKIDVKQRDA